MYQSNGTIKRSRNTRKHAREREGEWVKESREKKVNWKKEHLKDSQIEQV